MRKLALFFALVATMSAETVTDTLLNPSGTAVDATITICWSASYIDVDGNPVPAGCLAPFDTSSGLFSVVLDANDTNTPAGTSYAVSFRYANGTTTTQTWVVPTSVSALGITDVFSAVTPVPSATINVSLIAAGTNTVNITWTGTHDYSGGILELPNSTALIATQCDAANEAGRIYVDTDATSGQQVYVCEGLAGWVLQGDGGGAGGGDNITVNATAATNANFLDNTDISFSLDVGATPDDITASYVAGSIVDADINASAAIAGSKLNVAFTDLTGAATDAQVPDTITVDLATLATTATTANAGDSATAFFTSGAIEAARGGTAIDTSASTGFAQVAAGTWSVAAILDADVPDTITIANSSQITTNSAGDLSSGTIPVARVGADHIDSAGEVAADVIGTSELSDAADTPVLGHFLRVPTDTAAIEYGDLIGGAGITLGDVGGDVTIDADVTPTGTNTFSGTNDFTTGIVLLPGAAGAPAAGLCTSATVDRVYVDTADGGLTYICLQRGAATYTWEILLTAGDFSADATVTDAGAVAVVDDSHAHTGTTISALDTADITTGTWADARVAESNVTQHQAALSVTESQISDLSHTPDIDAVTGQANWGTAATKETADLIVSGVEVDFEAGGAEGYPRLAQSITPPVADCNEAAEAGRLYFDSDADTDGSVFICLGLGGWKDIDDDGGAGGFSSFDLDGDNASPQTITDGNTATIAGTAPISTVAGVTDTVTISLDAAGVDATHLGTDSVSADELNATGVEAELEAVLDLPDLQGAVTDAQVPDTITIDLAAVASTVDGTDAGAATTRTGENKIQISSHNTDCTSLTDGVRGEQCWEEDANTIYVCEPTAGDCDTAGEWIQVTAGAVSETNDLEATAPPTILDTEIFIGTGAGTGALAPVSGDISLANTGAATVLTGDSATGFFPAGAIEAARGGTGTDTSATTGVPQISGGTWGFSAGIIHLAVSSSANLRAVINDEVGGTGNLVFNANPTLAGATINGADLILSDGATDSPQVQFLPQTGTQWNLFVADVDDDFRLEVNTASTELWELENTGAGVIDLTVDGTITGTTAVAGPNVTSGADPGHTHTGASISALDAADVTTGTFAVDRGGTGAATLTDGGILLGSGTGAITALGVATNGQIPIGDGTTDPVLANITAEAGGEITVTNGAGSIELDVGADTLTAAEIDETGAFAFTTLNGKQLRNSAAVNDDDCTGEQGTWWYDTTDSAFEVCNANSGAPVTLDGSATETNDLEGTAPASILTTEIFIGTGSGTGAFAALSGDATMTSGGVVTLAANSVDSDEYTDGSIDTAHYAAGSVDTAAVEAELKTHVQSFSIDPTVAATGEAQFRWGYPITLTEIRCDTDAGTVASTNVEERAPTTPNTAGTAALTTALTCDTNSETGTVFTNATIDAWDPVALVYGTVTTATILRVYVEFTID